MTFLCTIDGELVPCARRVARPPWAHRCDDCGRVVPWDHRVCLQPGDRRTAREQVRQVGRDPRAVNGRTHVCGDCDGWVEQVGPDDLSRQALGEPACVVGGGNQVARCRSTRSCRTRSAASPCPPGRTARCASTTSTDRSTNRSPASRWGASGSVKAPGGKA